MPKSKKKILIVEDEMGLLDILVSMFTIEGFNVIKAEDGQEGLDVALEHHPDLILLDIVMPKMNGMDVLQKLRKDEWGKNVPIILLTNLSDSEKVEDAMKYGVYDYLIKTDWELKDVVKKVKEKLGEYND